jgi:hypothetical protein
MKAFLILTFTCFSCSNISNQRIQSSILSLDTTEALNQKQIVENDSIVRFISSNISKTQFSISKIRNDVLTNSKQLKEELITFCGGRDEYYNFTNPTEEKLVYEFLINQNKGKEFQELVNSIVKYSNQQGVEQRRIALDANEIPVFRNDPNQSKKTFVGIFFAESNLIEALIAMTTIESFVLQVESIYLNRVLMDDSKKAFKKMDG